VEGASSHHGKERCMTDRILEESQANVMATEASKRGTILLSPEFVL
jgi:hypothetical protein